MEKGFELAFEDVLAENRRGKIRNLLITDNNPDFLKDALHALRNWSVKKCINLVELDERENSWIFEIQSRELFEKLNRPNTVLLVKNYATENFRSVDENTPRNFLRDAVMNRHYGCGNDFEPSDELTELLFVVAINDLSEMSWKCDEYRSFFVIHRDNRKKVWTNSNFRMPSSKMHPVMSAVNKVKFWVSDDETTLCLDVRDAFRETEFRRPFRFLRADDRTEKIHTYIESNLPDFHGRVDRLILKAGCVEGEEHFLIDGKRLRKSFPKLECICSKDNVEIVNVDDEVCVQDPFELGEISFFLAQDNDISKANAFIRDLWALDRKWAKFFREVAKDYYRKPIKSDYEFEPYVQTGMDRLFHIYLRGCYQTEDGGNMVVTKHKNFDKAIALLPVRFQNCSAEEVVEKLCWDFRQVKSDERPELAQFTKVLYEAERIVPGILAKTACRVGTLG